MSYGLATDKAILERRVEQLEVALRNARSNLETHGNGELLRTCAGCRATHELIELALSSLPKKD